MALNPKLSNAAANAAADAVCALANNGYVRIYDGTQPADADTAVSDQTLLAEARLGATAFGAAVAGVATANAITDDSSINEAGTPTWFRVLASNGSTVLFDGSAGASGCNMNVSGVPLVQGATLSISSLTYTASKG